MGGQAAPRIHRFHGRVYMCLCVCSLIWVSAAIFLGGAKERLFKKAFSVLVLSKIITQVTNFILNPIITLLCSWWEGPELCLWRHFGCWPSWPALVSTEPALLLALAGHHRKVAPVPFWLGPVALGIWGLKDYLPFPSNLCINAAAWRVRDRSYGIESVKVKRSGF